METSPTVSIIVPARNEEASLRRCLESLTGQRGITFEIIVVDDRSTDRTHQIAESFAGVRVIQPPRLRCGWTGKNNAVTAGAREARGSWLLFTDADTFHQPGSLTRAVAEAHAQHADLLSYSPEQEVSGFWEKAVMPVIFAELASTYRPSEVSDPRSPVAAANGQYLLISREAYDAVGGHALIAASLLEDVALAQAVKASRRKIFFRYGGDAVSTRMYRTFAQLREGWTKNLALLFPAPGRLAALRLAEFTLIVGSAVVSMVMFGQARPALAVSAGVFTVAVFATLMKRIRKAHFAWDATLLSLFGLPLFSYLLLRSRISHKRGTVSWKGRAYGGPSNVESLTNKRAQPVHGTTH